MKSIVYRNTTFPTRLLARVSNIFFPNITAVLSSVLFHDMLAFFHDVCLIIHINLQYFEH